MGQFYFFFMLQDGCQELLGQGYQGRFCKYLGEGLGFFVVDEDKFLSFVLIRFFLNQECFRFGVRVMGLGLGEGLVFFKLYSYVMGEGSLGGERYQSVRYSFV